MKEMSLEEHLTELRKVAIRVLWILGISFCLTYSLGDRISEFLLIPLRDVIGTDDVKGKIVYLGVLDKVISQFQVAFYSGIFLSSPFWFREVWAFIKPGLYEKEVKVIRPFLFLGFLFFILGVCFGYYLVFPLTFQALLSFGVTNIDAMISLKEYLGLSCKVLVFLGFMFQLPNIMLILGFMGLATKYSYRTWRPYVYVGFAILSAVLTPPDVLTMMMMWIPLISLYEIGILAVAVVVHPYLEKTQSASDPQSN